jgi:hypothetical protein
MVPMRTRTLTGTALLVLLAVAAYQSDLRALDRFKLTSVTPKS